MKEIGEINMRILMIHISDLHVRSNDYFNQVKVDKIMTAINNLDNVDSVILICTGDFANEAKKEEYIVANRFIGYFLHKLGEKYNKFVWFLPVPGNHDISLNYVNEKQLDSIDKNLHDPIKAKELLNKELSKQNNYFDFITNGNWISKEKFDIYVKKINVEQSGIILNVRLINTAPFSLLTHRDKEMHYVNVSSISKFQNNTDLNITIMHHSSEWFHEGIKEILDDAIIKNTDILFLGHEHHQKSQIIFENGSKTIVSRGGEFNINDLQKDSYFNIILYDSIDTKVSFQTFYWDKIDNIYLPNTPITTEKIKTRYAYNLKRKFLDSIFKDDKITISKSFLDYYVLPKLRNQTDRKFLNVENIADLRKMIDKQKYVSFSAENDIGKTALLKALYSNYVIDKFVVFLNSEYFANNNIKNILRFAISEQYEGNNMYQKFIQMNNNEKVVIVDDFDKIKDEQVRYKLIEYLKTVFSIIIISTSSNNINLKQKFQDEYSLELFTYVIFPLTKNKRKDLIKKIFYLSNITENIDSISMLIEKRLTSMMNIRMVGNTFLINYVYQNIINYNSFLYDDKDNFDVIFETSLRNLIISNTNNKDVPVYLRILEIIASYVHFNKREKININEISKLIAEYKEEYEERVNTNIFITNMIKCKIFTYKNDDNYAFANRMYLSYFVAKHVCFQINSYNDYSLFQFILSNVCFGINSDILFFIIYLLQNVKIISAIFDFAEDITQNWTNISFDNDNINCFTGLKRINKKIKITNEIKNEINDSKDKQEIINIENYNISCEGLYDYNEEEVFLESNQVLCLYKCIQLLARSIPSFSSILTGDLKHTFASSLYDFTDKFLYKLIKPIDDEFDEFCLFLNSDGNKDDLSKIKSNLNRFLLQFVFITYDSVSKLAVSNRSINILCEEANINVCTNRIMKVLCLSNYNNEERFYTEADQFLKDYHKAYVMYLLQNIILQYIFDRDLNYKKRQKLLALANKCNGNRHEMINEKQIKLQKMKSRL